MNDEHHHKGKHQVNGKVYNSIKMPTVEDKKGFIHHIRSPTIPEDSYISEIIIENKIQFLLNF